MIWKSALFEASFSFITDKVLSYFDACKICALGVEAPTVSLRPCETEITQFNITIVVNKNICWLNVSMNDISRLYEVQSAQKFVNDYQDMLLTEIIIFDVLENVSQIRVDVVHHYEETVHVFAQN